jgi:hypothetical protein
MATSSIGASQAPGTNPLSIGAVTFNSSEAPVSLPIGGEQMTTSQTLAGGTRVVQTFGVSADEITWTGRLFGAYVQARVAQMRLYMSSGNPVPLSWVKAQLKEQYTVIVRKFKPTFFAQYAEYEITLVVVKATNGAYAAATPASIDTQINALQSQAVTLTNTLLAANAAQASAIAQSMTAVNASITAATPVSQNPLSGPSIQQSIQSAQSAILSYQALIPNSSSLFTTSLQLSGVLTAISRNVAAGYAPQSVTQQGGNAFTVAAQHYGDPSVAYTLASIAGLPSPFLPSGAFSVLNLPNILPKPSIN